MSSPWMSTPEPCPLPGCPPLSSGQSSRLKPKLPERLPLAVHNHAAIQPPFPDMYSCQALRPPPFWPHTAAQQPAPSPGHAPPLTNLLGFPAAGAAAASCRQARAPERRLRPRPCRCRLRCCLRWLARRLDQGGRLAHGRLQHSAARTGWVAPTGGPWLSQRRQGGRPALAAQPARHRPGYRRRRRGPRAPRPPARAG